MNDLVIMDDVYKRYVRRIGGIKTRLVGGKRDYVGSVQREWVLSGLSLKVKKGRSLGIIGPNGAGKSTILRLLQRSTVPNSGRIVINGSVSSIIELGAGFHPELTGLENLRIYSAFLGVPNKRMSKCIDEVADFSELGEALGWPIRAYSSGMIARLAFSVLTQTRSDLLCIDEVLSVGDYSFQKKSFDFLVSMKKNGGTFLIVSHSMDMLRKLCDEVIILRDGRVSHFGPASEALDLYLKQQQ